MVVITFVKRLPRADALRERFYGRRYLDGLQPSTGLQWTSLFLPYSKIPAGAF
jgi:hypothetical protein